ncbi:MAG: LysR family transcriptional regulator [Roseiarcus sp.]|jgi:LysR family hydrogen peroxide-inducible transcriptional activator
MMIDLTLRQLRYFDVLARHLHFGRAAGEAAVTQPALSMQIADLGAKLGTTLVERTRRGVTLTPEGTNSRGAASAFSTRCAI